MGNYFLDIQYALTGGNIYIAYQVHKCILFTSFKMAINMDPEPLKAKPIRGLYYGSSGKLFILQSYLFSLKKIY